MAALEVYGKPNSGQEAGGDGDDAEDVLAGSDEVAGKLQVSTAVADYSDSLNPSITLNSRCGVKDDGITNTGDHS